MPKLLDPLVIPLVIATVFTLSGYAILRVEKHVEMIGAWLRSATARVVRSCY